MNKISRKDIDSRLQKYLADHHGEDYPSLNLHLPVKPRHVLMVKYIKVYLAFVLTAVPLTAYYFACMAEPHYFASAVITFGISGFVASVMFLTAFYPERRTSISSSVVGWQFSEAVENGVTVESLLTIIDDAIIAQMTADQKIQGNMASAIAQMDLKDPNKIAAKVERLSKELIETQKELEAAGIKEYKFKKGYFNGR